MKTPEEIVAMIRERIDSVQSCVDCECSKYKPDVAHINDLLVEQVALDELLDDILEDAPPPAASPQATGV